jgi:anti-sigma factor RsiW
VRHPERELTPFIRGELGPRDRDRVAAHVDGCAECRTTLHDFRQLLHGFERATAPPEVTWARYRAEIREKLAARAVRPRPSWPWPVPVAVGAVLAGVLLLLAVRSPLRAPERLDLMAFEETVIGEQLDLLRDYPIIEQLDLLEDLDVIRQLDGLSSSRGDRRRWSREG